MTVKSDSKAAYRVVGRINGKPAGFVGMYRSRDNALSAAYRCSVPCAIKRVSDVADNMCDDLRRTDSQPFEELEDEASGIFR